jgi:hypothetical protein
MIRALCRRYAIIGRMALQQISFRSASQSMSSSANSKSWTYEKAMDGLLILADDLSSSLRDYYTLIDEKVVKNADLHLEVHKIPHELRCAFNSMLSGPVGKYGALL